MTVPVADVPRLIEGAKAVDDRGSVSFVNGFDFAGVRRSYLIANHRQGFVRAWHAHRREAKYVTVVSGAAVVAAVAIDDWDRPSKAAEGVPKVPLEGEEVPHGTRSQGREQPGVLYRGLRTNRGTGLDKGDHVAVETGVQDGVALENPYPGALPGIVGNQPHAPPLIGAAALLALAARFTASSILA